jgi:hypothetical protein
MRGVVRIALLVVLVVAAVVGTGCQFVAEKTAQTAFEAATGAKVDQSDGSLTVEKGGTKTTVGKDGEMPADFPSDVPVYQPSTVKAAVENTTDKGKSYVIGLNVSDDVATVVSWYEAEMESAGWTINQSVKLGDGGMVAGEKDGMVLVVTVGPATEAGAKATVTLSLNPK